MNCFNHIFVYLYIQYMLVKCKTCAKEFIPPRKNILNCSKCVISSRKQPEGAASQQESESEPKDDEESESAQNDDEEYEKYGTTTN